MILNNEYSAEWKHTGISKFMLSEQSFLGWNVFFSFQYKMGHDYKKPASTRVTQTF